MPLEKIVHKGKTYIEATGEDVVLETIEDDAAAALGAIYNLFVTEMVARGYADAGDLDIERFKRRLKKHVVVAMKQDGADTKTVE